MIASITRLPRNLTDRCVSKDCKSDAGKAFWRVRLIPAGAIIFDLTRISKSVQRHAARWVRITASRCDNHNGHRYR